jgi:PAS domain S-box-containing protein
MSAMHTDLDAPFRLQSLHALHVLDTPPEAEFDALVRTAAAVCRVPIALISLIDDHRQWFKANHGLPGVTQTPRDVAFCAHTVNQGQWLEVEDACVDPRFSTNPLVQGDPHIRLYAAAPVKLDNGAVIGTICVIDRVPRQLDDQQREVLSQLALVVSRSLEGRRALMEVRQAAQALMATEAKFRALSEHAPMGVFHTDPHGSCNYTNRRWQDIYGLSLEQSLGQGWTQTLHPSDREFVFSTWQKVAEAGGEFDCEFRILRPDQSIRVVRSRARSILDIQGGITGYVGSVEDISRHKQLEALLDRTGRFAGVGGWELDIRTRVLTWSEQTKRIHEVPTDFVPTVETAIRFYAPEVRQALSDVVQSGIDKGLPWDMELPMITATGRKIWVRAAGEVEMEGGRVVRLLGAIKDVTEIRMRGQALHDEQALRQEVERQAQQTERLLSERNEMLNILAHEVRQPLNNASAALQSASSVLAAGSVDQPVSPRLDRARSVMSQVLASIDNTLAVASLLARPDPIERDDTDIDTLIAVTIADLSSPDRDRVKVQRSSCLRTASMDMSLIRLALRNLLSNALRHSQTDSIVRIHLSDSDEPLALVIDVCDDGYGIPDSMLPRLFERGAHRRILGEPVLDEAPNSVNRGLGLGLYIVKRVMELHGGQVSLLRNTPQGVTMRLLIVQPSGD